MLENYFLIGSNCYFVTIENFNLMFYRFNNGKKEEICDGSELKSVSDYFLKYVSGYSYQDARIVNAIIDNPTIHFKTNFVRIADSIAKQVPAKYLSLFIHNLRTQEFNDLHSFSHPDLLEESIYRQIYLKSSCNHKGNYGFSSTKSTYDLLNTGLLATDLEERFARPVLEGEEVIYSKLVKQLISLTSKRDLLNAYYSGTGVDTLSKTLDDIHGNPSDVEKVFSLLRILYFHRSMHLYQPYLKDVQEKLICLAYYKAESMPYEQGICYLKKFRKLLVDVQDLERLYLKETGPIYGDLVENQALMTNCEVLLSLKKEV